MSKTTLFADIILPLFLPKAYTYRVPSGWEEDCAVGKRVVVQLGKAKLYTGIISSLHHQPPEHYQAKYLEAILDEHPIVTKEQLALWEWMKEYYMCYPGEIFNVALPGNLKLNSETKFYPHPELEEYQNDLTDKEVKILELLTLNPGMSIQEISTSLEVKSVQGFLKKMVDKKLITSEEEIKNRYKPKLETVFHLNEIYQDNAKLNDLLNVLEKRSPKQVDVLMLFLKLSLQNDNKFKAIRKFEILQQFPQAEHPLIALEKKQVLVAEKIEVDRLNAEQHAFTGLKELNVSQNKKLEEIHESFKKHDISLLHGVTASGKTEIYFHLIEEQLLKGKQVLFLMPEIAITTQMVKRLQKAFGNVVGVYHSRFNPNERIEVWKKTLAGPDKGFKIIIGARSAVFLPFRNLGLVIVDEEHETSYKQQQPSPRYNGRDVAIVLAHLFGAKTLLGSATPSIESFSNAKNDKYGYIELKERYSNTGFPEIVTVDLKEERKHKRLKEEFSELLLEEIGKVLDRKKQIIIFQNRRGYTPLWMCNDCSWTAQCNHCNVNLTYHKKTHQLICHYCNTHYVPESRCRACGSNNVRMLGLGTEKIEETLELFFPNAKTGRMDLDTTRSKNAYRKIIDDFENGHIDILIGTQMVTKGLDFSNVSLVAIPSADSILHFPEFRAHEKAFQMFTQVTGRAGRKHEAGKVIIQTNDVKHPVLEFIKAHDFEHFYTRELIERKKFFYPPYSRLIYIELSHVHEQTVDQAAHELAQTLKTKLQKRLLGPEKPLINKINNKFLMCMTIKLEKTHSFNDMKHFIAQSIDDFRMFSHFKAVRIIVDVDPL